MERIDAGRELVHQSNIEYFRELTRRSGGQVMDVDGLTCVASPHPDPHLLNAAFATDRDFPADDFISRALDFFAGAQRRFSFHALVDRDEDLVAQALKLGFVPGGDPDPLQIREAAPISTDLPHGIELRPVLDAPGVSDLTEICRVSHKRYGFPDDMFPTLFARPAAAIGPHLHAVVAYEVDRPVATGTLFLTHGVTYLGWIATVPDCGRRGLGSSLTAWMVSHGYELGGHHSVLLASPMGTPVYRRLGFADVGGLQPLLSPA